jgi:acetylornithine deacetylase/succinyl-diaminopimelate desuccinylase-like protein
LKAKIVAIPYVETHTDAAGNFWATLRGESDRELLIGGHMDSVPNGGWLDGCLNVLTGVEILRRVQAEFAGRPPVTVRVVDWADEEGARFGKSLFGSSACAGTFGVERHAITFRGQAAHSGSTPMNRRKDALLAAAKMSLEIYDIAERSGGGVCTIGSCTTKPGIVTSVVEECRITLDQRHLDPAALARMYAEAKAASERFAREGNVTVTWERLWHIAPRPFHPELIALCDQAIRETCGASHRLPSGPLHDAAEMCGAGVPTVMLFVQSLHGISHNKIEDTREEHLEMSVRALDRLATATMGWIAGRN